MAKEYITTILNMKPALRKRLDKEVEKGATTIIAWVEDAIERKLAGTS